MFKYCDFFTSDLLKMEVLNEPSISHNLIERYEAMRPRCNTGFSNHMIFINPITLKDVDYPPKVK